MKPTDPFMNDDLTFCIARAKLYPRYLSIMHVFDTELWFFIMPFAFVFGFILFVALKFSSNEKKLDIVYCVTLFVYRLLVNSPTNFNPKSTWLRMFLISVQLFSLFFFGYAFTYLQIRVSEPYRSDQVSERRILFEENYSIKSTIDILERLRMSVGGRLSKQFSLCVDTDECLNELTENDCLAVCVSREYVLKHFNFNPEEIFCFNRSEHIESLQISFLVRKDSFLNNLINKEIRSYSEAGLISKWINDYQKLRIIQKPNEEIYFVIGHAAALFLFGGTVGLNMALMALILELIANARFPLLNKLGISNYLEICVDGKRHYLLD